MDGWSFRGNLGQRPGGETHQPLGTLLECSRFLMRTCTILPKMIFYLLVGLLSGDPPNGLAQRLAYDKHSINRRCFFSFSSLLSNSSWLALPAHLPVSWT